MPKKELKYRVGGIEGCSGNWIVNLENENELVFYGAPRGTHRDIANYFNIKSPVLGGGEYKMRDNVMLLFGFSTDFGPVPNVVAKEIGKCVKNYLEQSGNPIDKVSAHTEENYLFCDSFKWQKERWESLGIEI